MTWADIAAGVPITPPIGRSASVASVVPDVPAAPQLSQASSAQGMSSLNSSFASMSLANFGSANTHASIVESKAAPAQAISKQGANRRNRGGKKNHKGPSKGKVVETKSSTTGVPLKEFHLFPRLPAELRFKIYRLTMTQRRLIELEWAPTELVNGSHHWVRVCPRSRQPPTIMHVSRESREEAEKVHKLRCFDSPVATSGPNSPELPKHYIWYNPSADIIFFGEDTCISTYISVFGNTSQDIPAIAIVNSSKNETCCDHDDETYGVDGGVDTLQALHGFDPSETLHHSRYGGCPGLKEVFVVVKSRLWLRKQGEINNTVTLRPATNNGLTRGQVAFKARLEQRIGRVEAEVPLPGVGENIWTGDKKPTFSFVSFAPVAWSASRECDGTTVSSKDLWKLSRGDWGFIKRTEVITNCEIVIPDEDYKGENPREIGFLGSPKSIEAAKKAIEDRLAQLRLQNQKN